MLEFIGTKVVNAHPMTRGEYNTFRGWPLPDDEKADEEGYLVEYPESKANTASFNGYVTWSPKAVFDAAYHDINRMSFGHAIELLKRGRKVARRGWNGKGMWLSLSGDLGGTAIEAHKFWSPHNAAYAHACGGRATVLPTVTMKTATGEILMGWLASQSDMLAEDWMEVR